MSTVATRRIGLSLGADLCWPACFEALVKRLDLALPIGKETVKFEVDRVTIEPFSLRQPVRYDVVLDRITHWYMPTREWVKKAIVHDDTYVLNNPWSIQSMEKHTTYAAMMRLGFPVPETWLVPPKSYEPKDDLQVTLQRYAKLFDLGAVGAKVGYPLFMKPYDGGAWVGVSKVDDEAQLRAAYEKSGTRVMHLQKAVAPFDLFVRGLGFGPQFTTFRYDAAAPLHARYVAGPANLSAEDTALMRDMMSTSSSLTWALCPPPRMRLRAWFSVPSSHDMGHSRMYAIHNGQAKSWATRTLLLYARDFGMTSPTIRITKLVMPVMMPMPSDPKRSAERKVA
jgi:hypothetical protein